MANSFSHLIAAGAVVFAIFDALFFLFLICAWAYPRLTRTKTSSVINTYFLEAIFAISSLAIVGSLFYSQGIGFVPCVLCWYQRIFLFPQPVIAGMALWFRDRVYAPQYLFVMTCIGGCVALYHSVIQYVGSSPLPCSAEGVSCVQRLVFEFGFVTIPFMSLVIYAGIFGLLLHSMFVRR